MRGLFQFALLYQPAHAIDNGLGLTPPMGWRHWKAFYAHIDQWILEDMQDEMVKKYPVDGVPTSLQDLGYLYVGLDDHWQNCTSVCPNGTIADDGGYDTWSECCRDADGKCVEGSKTLPWYLEDGTPLFDKHRFPDVKGMVDRSHRLGLRSGWYFGNFQCRSGADPDHTYNLTRLAEGSVNAIKQYGFDSVKLDSGFPVGSDLGLWADLLNATGRPVMIENCHQGGSAPGMDDPKAKHCTGLTDLSDCPYNFWRTTGDPWPSWGSFMGALNTLRKVSNPDYGGGKHGLGLSFEECDSSDQAQQWELLFDDAKEMASVKSSSVGQCLEINGCKSSDHAGVDTNFGCKKLPSPEETNPCAKNMAWNINANGTITSVMSGKCLQPSATGLEVTSCDDSAVQAWEVHDVGAGRSTIREAHGDRRCLTQAMLEFNDFPPRSRPGAWAYANTMTIGDGSMSKNENRVHFGSWCITSNPLILAYNLSDTDRHNLVWDIITNKEAIQVNQIWDGHPGRQVLWNAGSNKAVEVWIKPVGQGRTAAFVINTENKVRDNATITIQLSDLGITGQTKVRDVWQKEDLPLTSDTLTTQLEYHGSQFFVFSPVDAQWPIPFEVAPWLRVTTASSAAAIAVV